MGAGQTSTAQPYPLKVMYDAQAVLAPDEHIGKGAHLLNLLGALRESFIGVAPPGKARPGSRIRQRGFSDYNTWQQLSLPSELYSEKPDVFVAPFNTAPLVFPRRTKLLLVVHDLITFERFDNIGLRFRLLLTYWRYLTAISIRRAFIVITVSEFSRAEILRKFPKAQVVVLTNCIYESWYVREGAKPDSERGNYVLMVSAMSPHKNMDRGLQAYAAYAREAGSSAADLQIVGVSATRAAGLQPRLQELGISDRVKFAPYLSLAELQELYRRAKAFLIPSLMEGFGIPVLEAMASGTPVISSSATSLPEVGGSAPEYFDPLDVAAMAAALTKVLSDSELRTGMAERGLVQAETFHPEVVREQIAGFWAGLPARMGRKATAKNAPGEPQQEGRSS